MVDTKPTEPVFPQEIYQAICGAASQDPATVQSSSKQLQEYQNRPGTYDQLHIIASERNNIPLDVRRMAIIQFKNGALGVWKNKRLFNDDIRSNIRGRALSFLYEEDNTIADYNALIIAKIARSDFPTQWPSLLVDLTGIMQTQIEVFLSNPTDANPGNTLLLKRTLRVLDQIVKEFSTIRLPIGIRTMATLADTLYSPLISYYDRLSSLLLASFSTTALLDPLLQRTCEDVVELSHFVFKPCTRIMLWLWQKAGQPQFSTALETLSVFSQSCFQLARNLFDRRLQLTLALRQDYPTDTLPKPLYYLTKHLRLYGKMFRRMQQLSCTRFVALPQANELVLYYWDEVVKATNSSPDMVSDSPDAVYPIRLLVQAMVLFRESLNVWSGKGNLDKMTEVLSEQFVEEAVRLLLTRFIPLAPKDLEKWSLDPEEWSNEEEKDGDAWEYELRPCAERVLLTICNQYHVFVLPLLLKTLQQILASPTTDLTSILQKEAMYCAIGRCVHKLQGHLNFDDWLQNHLIPEAQESNPNYRIVKRRIAWVIGKWHAYESNRASKPQVWEVLRHLLCDRGPSSDPVVRFTAAQALRECIDTEGFDVETFQPFLGDFITDLIRLIGEADTLDGKTRLTGCLTIVIERVESRIIPFIDVIVNPLPGLWQDAGEDYLLKASLIVAVTHLVEATREHSAAISNVIISLVQESFSTKASLHLDQDGLQLWLMAIRNARTLDSTGNGVPSYIDLFPHAVMLLSENLDLLGSLIKVIESYVLLDCDKILSMYARELFQAFDYVLPRALQSNTKDIIILINLVTQISPPTLWAEPIHSSNLFAGLVKRVIDDQDNALILAEHIYVFARMALSDPLVFNQLVISSAPALKMLETQVFEGILDQWWNKFDFMAVPQYRKLAAMGIACWVSTGRPEVLDRLHTEIFNLWLDVFGELKEALTETTNGTRSPLSAFWRDSTQEPVDLLPEEVVKTLEADRRRQIHYRDPINTLKLTIFVQERLQQAEIASGGTQVFRAKYLEKADPTVLNQLSVALLTGN